MKLSAKDYIEKIKEENAKKKRVEKRPNFFYVPKLNEMMLMEKSVIPRAKVSDIYLYVLKRKLHEDYDLSKLTKSKRTEFFKENTANYEVYNEVPIGIMLSYIDKLDYINFLSPIVNHLSVLKVNSYYRGLGLSKELINELINETANYGYPLIKARMSALDYSQYTDEKEQKEIDEKIYNISQDRHKSEKIDLQTLANIYKHLGFKVSKDYENNRNITLDVKYENINKKDRYPESYLDFNFNKETSILIR